MSYLMIDREDEIIDYTRERTDYVSPVVTQADDPGQDLQRVGGVKLSELPDPTVGGVNGSGVRNGYSTGFRPLTARTQPFLGGMAKPPAITNAVIGTVGQSGRAGRLYAGVMDQLTNYSPTELDTAKAYVGKL